jgi:hypothetical protein
MTTLLRKYSTLILISLLLAVLILGWFLPSAGYLLGILFLFFSFFLAAVSVFVKYSEQFHQGKVTRSVFIRTVCLEITGAWFAMAFAGLLGRSIAAIATQHLTDALVQLLLGVLIGLLIGAVVGVLVNQMWGRVVRVSSE